MITLIFITVITALIMISLSQSSFWRQISSSSAGQARADFLAHDALSVIEGDFLEEARAGSTANASGTTTNFVPLTNFMVVPQRAATAISNGLTNLVYESASGVPVWQSGNGLTYMFDGPIRAAAGNSSATASHDGHYISMSTWLESDLLSGSEGAKMPAPDWVIITRQGPLTNAVGASSVTPPALSDLGNAAPSNLNYAIGRFAYVVYDESGLIDINAAGYPSGGAGLTPAQTAVQVGRKGLLSFADLTQIPNGGGATLTQAQVDALIAWRNASSNASYFSYLTNFASTNGFLHPTPGDQAFVSRQDLINYAQDNGLTNALPYLTTFTREDNSPSWSPRYNAADLGGSSTFAYRDQATANAAQTVNPNVLNIRVSTPFSRPGDPIPAVAGDPLIKRRFPLSRLALLSGGGSASDILSYFGLSGSSSAGWTYNHGNPGAILTLDQVAAAGREPDFFELLKAAILRGSLGMSPGVPQGGTGPASAPSLFTGGNSDQVLEDCQIIQIGANIIDQYDSDSIPTEIIFAGPTKTLIGDSDTTQFFGIENLPYPTRMILYTYVDPTDPHQPTTYPAHKVMGFWLMPELWKPHQQPTQSLTTPAFFKLQLWGSAVPGLSLSAGGPTTGGTSISFTNPSIHLNAGEIDFSSGTIGYDHPNLISANAGRESPAGSSAGLNDRTAWNSPAGPPTWKPYDLQGIYMGYVSLDGFPATNLAAYLNNSNLQLELEWSSDGTNWHPYVKWENLSTWGQNYLPDLSSIRGLDCLCRVDPRTDRFGSALSYLSMQEVSGYTYNINSSMRPASDAGAPMKGNIPVTTTGSTFTSDMHIGTYADNNSSSPAAYTDPDGIRRGAGGYYTGAPGSQSTSEQDGYPLFGIEPNPSGDGVFSDDEFYAAGTYLPNRQNGARPLVLNRPFQSVGELGYTFRDQPFKDLDFFTHASADAALLDFFSAYDEPALVAGRVSLNSPHPEVISALLSGSISREYASTTTLSSLGYVPGIAAALVKRTGDMTPSDKMGPFQNRSDLVTEFSDDLTSVLSSPSSFPDKVDKTRREAVVRALADVGNTRTWNLMIDLVAQAGRYPPHPKDLNDFVVEGERHYWLHVAIDRFTGKILDESCEPVAN